MLRKRMLPLFLALALVMLLPAAASAADLTPEEREQRLAFLRWSHSGIPGEELEFDPAQLLTRGMAAELLAQLLGLRERADMDRYSDVDAETPHYAAVAQCVAAGVLDGLGDGRMAPELSASREMLALMLSRALDVPETEVSWGTKGSDYAPVTGYELLAAMDSLIGAYANEPNTALRAPGRGLALVAAPGVVVNGEMEKLVIAPGAGDGTITLVDATVRDRVLVRAPATVFLSGETLAEAVVLDEGGQEARVVGDGIAVVGSVSSTVPVEETFSETEPRPAPEPTPAPAPVPEPESETEEEPQPEAEAEPQPEAPPEEPAGEAEAREALPYLAEKIGPAPLTDADKPDAAPYESYTVRAWEGGEESGCDVLVEVTMKGLRPYRSGSAGAGYWTGFSIEAPEGATGYRVAYSTTGEVFGEPEEYDLTGDAFTRYFDAARWREYYVLLQWTGSGFSQERQPRLYRIDFDGVELDTAPLLEKDSPLGRLDVAGLNADAEGKAPYSAYGITVENRKDRNGSYLELTVHARDLQRHRSAAGAGAWAGFSVAEPRGAASCRCSVYLTLDAAKKNFSGKTPVYWENFSANVDGLGAYGIRQLTDASQPDQRDYWAVIQWYSDAAGTVPMTTATVYHILLDVTLAETTRNGD